MLVLASYQGPGDEAMLQQDSYIDIRVADYPARMRKGVK